MLLVGAAVVLGACSSGSSTTASGGASTTNSSVAPTVSTVVTTEQTKQVADHLINVHHLTKFVVVQDSTGRIVITTQIAVGDKQQGVEVCTDAQMVAGSSALVVKAKDQSVLATASSGGTCTAAP